MPFKESTRQWWFRVTGQQCQYEAYTEKKGFQVCGDKATHVHHIKGETETLLEGGNPEENVALPLCKRHHVRNTGEVLGEDDSSFHPDIGRAFDLYGTWKSNTEHMNSITGKRAIDYSQSPFAEVAREHKQKVQHGERYINGDEGTDEHYTEKMVEKAVLYQAEHPEDKKPKTKPHPLTDRTKKKHWYDTFFEG